MFALQYNVLSSLGTCTDLLGWSFVSLCNPCLTKCCWDQNSSGTSSYTVLLNHRVTSRSNVQDLVIASGTGVLQPTAYSWPTVFLQAIWRNYSVHKKDIPSLKFIFDLQLLPTVEVWWCEIADCVGERFVLPLVTCLKETFHFDLILMKTWFWI